MCDEASHCECIMGVVRVKVSVRVSLGVSKSVHM